LFADVFNLAPISPSVLPASVFNMFSYCIESNLLLENFSNNFNFSPVLTRCIMKFLPEFMVTSSSSGPRAYAPDAPQPCRLIVLPSYYSSVFDIPTFVTSPSSSSM
jgi:hypothetical protein